MSRHGSDHLPLHDVLHLLHAALTSALPPSHSSADVFRLLLAPFTPIADAHRLPTLDALPRALFVEALAERVFPALAQPLLTLADARALGAAFSRAGAAGAVDASEVASAVAFAGEAGVAALVGALRSWVAERVSREAEAGSIGYVRRFRRVLRSLCGVAADRGDARSRTLVDAVEPPSSLLSPSDVRAALQLLDLPLEPLHSQPPRLDYGDDVDDDGSELGSSSPRGASRGSPRSPVVDASLGDSGLSLRDATAPAGHIDVATLHRHLRAHVPSSRAYELSSRHLALWLEAITRDVFDRCAPGAIKELGVEGMLPPPSMRSGAPSATGTLRGVHIDTRGSSSRDVSSAAALSSFRLGSFIESSPSRAARVASILSPRLPRQTIPAPPKAASPTAAELLSPPPLLRLEGPTEVENQTLHGGGVSVDENQGPVDVGSARSADAEDVASSAAGAAAPSVIIIASPAGGTAKGSGGSATHVVGAGSSSPTLSRVGSFFPSKRSSPSGGGLGEPLLSSTTVSPTSPLTATAASLPPLPPHLSIAPFIPAPLPHPWLIPPSIAFPTSSCVGAITTLAVSRRAAQEASLVHEGFEAIPGDLTCGASAFAMRLWVRRVALPIARGGRGVHVSADAVSLDLFEGGVTPILSSLAILPPHTPQGVRGAYSSDGYLEGPLSAAGSSFWARALRREDLTQKPSCPPSVITAVALTHAQGSSEAPLRSVTSSSGSAKNPVLAPAVLAEHFPLQREAIAKLHTPPPLPSAESAGGAVAAATGQWVAGGCWTICGEGGARGPRPPYPLTQGDASVCVWYWEVPLQAVKGGVGGGLGVGASVRQVVQQAGGDVSRSSSNDSSDDSRSSNEGWRRARSRHRSSGRLSRSRSRHRRAQHRRHGDDDDLDVSSFSSTASSSSFSERPRRSRRHYSRSYRQSKSRQRRRSSSFSSNASTGSSQSLDAQRRQKKPSRHATVVPLPARAAFGAPISASAPAPPPLDAAGVLCVDVLRVTDFAFSLSSALRAAASASAAASATTAGGGSNASDAACAQRLRVRCWVEGPASVESPSTTISTPALESAPIESSGCMSSGDYVWAPAVAGALSGTPVTMAPFTSPGGASAASAHVLRGLTLRGCCVALPVPPSAAAAAATHRLVIALVYDAPPPSMSDAQVQRLPSHRVLGSTDAQVAALPPISQPHVIEAGRVVLNLSEVLDSQHSTPRFLDVSVLPHLGAPAASPVFIAAMRSSVQWSPFQPTEASTATTIVARAAALSSALPVLTDAHALAARVKAAAKASIVRFLPPPAPPRTSKRAALALTVAARQPASSRSPLPPPPTASVSYSFFAPSLTSPVDAPVLLVPRMNSEDAALVDRLRAAYTTATVPDVTTLLLHGHRSVEGRPMTIAVAACEVDALGTGLIPAAHLQRTLARCGITLDVVSTERLVTLLLSAMGAVVCEGHDAINNSSGCNKAVSDQWSTIRFSIADDAEHVFIDHVLLADLLHPLVSTPHTTDSAAVSTQSVRWAQSPGGGKRPGAVYASPTKVKERTTTSVRALSEEAETAAVIAALIRHRLRLRIAHGKLRSAAAEKVTRIGISSQGDVDMSDTSRSSGGSAVSSICSESDAYVPVTAAASVSLVEIMELCEYAASCHPEAVIITPPGVDSMLIGAGSIRVPTPAALAAAHQRSGWAGGSVLTLRPRRILPVVALGDALEDSASCLVRTRDLALLARARGLLLPTTSSTAPSFSSSFEEGSAEAADARALGDEEAGLEAGAFAAALVAPAVAAHRKYATAASTTALTAAAVTDSPLASMSASTSRAAQRAATALAAAVHAQARSWGPLCEEELALQSGLRGCARLASHLPLEGPFLDAAAEERAEGGGSTEGSDVRLSLARLKSVLEDALVIVSPSTGGPASLSHRLLTMAAQRCGSIATPHPSASAPAAPAGSVSIPLFLAVYGDLSRSEYSALASRLQQHATVARSIDATTERRPLYDEHVAGAWASFAALSTAAGAHPATMLSRHVIAALHEARLPLSHAEALLLCRKFAARERGGVGGGGAGFPVYTAPLRALTMLQGEQPAALLDSNTRSFLESLAPAGASIHATRGAGEQQRQSSQQSQRRPDVTGTLRSTAPQAAAAARLTEPVEWCFPYSHMPPHQEEGEEGEGTALYDDDVEGEPRDTVADLSGGMLMGSVAATRRAAALASLPRLLPRVALPLGAEGTASPELRAATYVSTGRWLCDACLYECNEAFSRSCILCEAPNTFSRSRDEADGAAETDAGVDAGGSAPPPIRVAAASLPTPSVADNAAPPPAPWQLPCVICAYEGSAPADACRMCGEAYPPPATPAVDPPPPPPLTSAPTSVRPVSPIQAPPTVVVDENHCLSSAPVSTPQMLADPWRTRHQRVGGLVWGGGEKVPAGITVARGVAAPATRSLTGGPFRPLPHGVAPDTALSFDARVRKGLVLAGVTSVAGVTAVQ